MGYNTKTLKLTEDMLRDAISGDDLWELIKLNTKPGASSRPRAEFWHKRYNVVVTCFILYDESDGTKIVDIVWALTQLPEYPGHLITSSSLAGILDDGRNLQWQLERYLSATDNTAYL